MRMRLWVLLAGAALFVRSTMSASIITTFGVGFDTTSIEGTGPFELAFLLTDGSGTGDQNTTVTLNNFQFGAGGSPEGVTPDSTGGFSGSLTTAVELTDSAFFNLFGSDFQPGKMLTFHVGIVDASLDSPTPDLFQFVILDASGNQLATSDPSGGNSLLIDTLDSSNPVAQTFVLVAATPEPGSLGLFLAAACLVGLLCGRRLEKG